MKDGEQNCKLSRYLHNNKKADFVDAYDNINNIVNIFQKNGEYVIRVKAANKIFEIYFNDNQVVLLKPPVPDQLGLSELKDTIPSWAVNWFNVILIIFNFYYVHSGRHFCISYCITYLRIV